MEVAVVGAGRVGTALAVLLRRAGHAVVAVSGRGATRERVGHYLPEVPVCSNVEAAATIEVVGAATLREGYAWAFTRYSNDYIADEARAKAAKLGIHAHDCLPAWEWRAQQRR